LIGKTLYTCLLILFGASCVTQNELRIEEVVTFPENDLFNRIPGGWLNDEGEQVSFEAWQEEPVLLTFFYTSCTRICPKTMGYLKDLEARLGSEADHVQFVLVTLDPKKDNLTRINSYQKGWGLQKKNWHFLQGSPDSTQFLNKELSYGAWKMDEHTIHRNILYFFDQKKEEVKVYSLSKKAHIDSLEATIKTTAKIVP
jgi:cytochrome oxidase Cu insertion factor (SCO1/SenC/PrrC family)